MESTLAYCVRSSGSIPAVCDSKVQNKIIFSRYKVVGKMEPGTIVIWHLHVGSTTSHAIYRAKTYCRCEEW